MVVPKYQKEQTGMMHKSKKLLCLTMALVIMASLTQPALAAGVSYMPDVTAEMSDASYWANLSENAQEVILTPEEIEAYNRDTELASGTMVMDLKSAGETFDGKARNEAIRTSATADAQYYFGWTYGADGKKAEWSYYEKMIKNCIDPKAKKKMAVRYGIAVERTILQVFPSENPIWDDPTDPDFNYQALSAVCVNDPLLIYTTSKDGKYYLARSVDCSGWVRAEDVAICADKEEWLSAWDLPSQQLLVVYGNKEYTDQSLSTPETARRMLTQGTALELVTGLAPDTLVGNRSPYHNYVVYLPVRNEDGSYKKMMALIPETAKVCVGYLPLTEENIAMVALQTLGDAYGWGGMMDVEDCSGMIRTIYSCFGLTIGRNGNWQWNMSMEKIDMTNMSVEEKCLILDALPLGSALCFTGHEMLYLGKVDGKYYVVSTVSSIMSPDTGKRLRTRDVMINTLDTKRASGQSWLGALNKAFTPAYALLEGKSYDYPDLQWYHDGVAYCLSKKLLTAKDVNGTFGIGETADRAILANALWVMAGKPAAQMECPFLDVGVDASYRTAVTWAAETGIMRGCSDDTFAPVDPLTREQLITALYRYETLLGNKASAGAGDLSAFLDASAVSAYAQEALAWACGSGLVTGSEDGLLSPAGGAAREQLAMILYRYSQLPEAPAEAETTETSFEF